MIDPYHAKFNTCRLLYTYSAGTLYAYGILLGDVRVNPVTLAAGQVRYNMKLVRMISIV